LPPPAPGADQGTMQAMQIDDYDNGVSYLFGPRGDLYSIDNTCIELESAHPYSVPAREIDHSKLRSFGVQSLIETPAYVLPEMIVVVNIEGTVDNYWFVRIQAHEKDGTERGGFGYDFLWQVPPDWCRHILYAMANAPVTGLNLELTSDLFPTLSVFDPESQKLVCKKNPILTTLECKAFFMFTRPSTSGLSTSGLSSSPRSTSCARPAEVTGCRTFDITQLDDDTGLMILETCVGSLLNGRKKTACKGLLSLRGVCSLFRDTVDAATEIYTKDIFDMIQSSLTSSCTMKMQHTRNRISDLECNLFDKVLYHRNVDNMTFYSLFMDIPPFRNSNLEDDESIQRLKRMRV
jgi:hypothetical protein